MSSGQTYASVASSSLPPEKPKTEVPPHESRHPFFMEPPKKEMPPENYMDDFDRQMLLESLQSKGNYLFKITWIASYDEDYEEHRHDEYYQIPPTSSVSLIVCSDVPYTPEKKVIDDVRRYFLSDPRLYITSRYGKINCDSIESKTIERSIKYAYGYYTYQEKLPRPPHDTMAEIVEQYKPVITEANGLQIDFR